MLLRSLLGAVTLSHWRLRWVRTLLTVGGIALGSTTIVAIADISHSILASFDTMVDTLAGSADLEITSAATPLSDEVIDRAGATHGVTLAAGVVERFVPVDEPARGQMLLLGLDFLESTIWERHLPRSAITFDDTFEFVSNRDSIAVPRRFADRAGLRMGDTLAVVAPEGRRTLRIRALIGDTPVTQLFDGAIAVMDLPRAQALLGMGRHLDRIVIEGTDGTPLPSLISNLQRTLGPGYRVDPPEGRGEAYQRMLFSLRSMLVVAGSLAVIVGALIVYQAVSVSVQQRRRTFALLGAIGIARPTLVTLCLLETGLLALTGAVLGAYAGKALSAMAAGLVGVAVSDIWTPVHVDVATASAYGVPIAAMVALTMALGAALIAVRATLSASTVEALRPTLAPFERAVIWQRALVVAGVLVAATWLITLVPPDWSWGVVTVVIASQLSAYSGLSVLAPAVIAGTGAILGRTAGHIRHLPWCLATDSLPRTPRRTGMTLTMIGAAITMAVSLGGLVQSFDDAWRGWITQHFDGDIFVGSGTRFRLTAGAPMSDDIGRRVAGAPGVAAVEPFRVLPLTLHSRPVFLQAVSVPDRLAHGGLPMTEGDLARAAPSLLDGTGVLLSDNLAYRLGAHVGTTIDVPTPAGPRPFTVVGTFIDYLGALDLGAIVTSTEQLTAIWGDRSANLYRVWLAPGQEVTAIREDIERRLGSGYYALTASRFLESAAESWQPFFAASWLLVAVAILVAGIGTINAQVANVLDRSPEIAMLRTIGVPRRDVMAAVVLECLLVATVGVACGLALGTMLSGQFVTVTMRLLTGWRLPFHLPYGLLAMAGVLAIVASALAGSIPARTAADIDSRQRSID